ncbi:catechol 2,3-dioxygenase-like lactoylglutathione lyase family enzyme [Devosia sp. UYZn731]|uniref:VOC family protein n=1 Tax=Devosia sp. UYZn731 TaxID=3156345 RepID=UPI003399E33B
MPNFRLDHVSMLVRDITISTQFYVDVFGWPIVRTSGDPVTGQWLGIGGNDTCISTRATWPPPR